MNNVVQAIDIDKGGKLYLKEFHDCMNVLQASKYLEISSMAQDYLYLYCADNLPDELTQKVVLLLFRAH